MERWLVNVMQAAINAMARDPQLFKMSYVRGMDSMGRARLVRSFEPYVEELCEVCDVAFIKILQDRKLCPDCSAEHDNMISGAYP